MTKKIMREGADSAEAVTSRTAAENESQSLHTPGPWHIERVNGVWIDSEFGGVAKVLGFGHEDDETTPNAHLIAAAPDLLAALKVTRGNILSLGPAGALESLPDSYRVWLRVVDEAIAKAEAQ